MDEYINMDLHPNHPDLLSNPSTEPLSCGDHPDHAPHFADHHPPIIATKETARAVHSWLVYNEYILHGYRVHFHSYPQLLRSVFRWHNETTNIWSHLLGVLVFLGLIVYFAVVYKPFDITNSQVGALQASDDPALFSQILKTGIYNITKDFCPQ